MEVEMSNSGSSTPRAEAPRSGSKQSIAVGKVQAALDSDTSNLGLSSGSMERLAGVHGYYLSHALISLYKRGLAEYRDGRWFKKQGMKAEVETPMPCPF